MDSQIENQKAYQLVLQFLKDSRNCDTSVGQHKIWNKFVENLKNIDIDNDFSRALQIWSMENLQTHHPETVRVRELHEIEATFIPPKGHGKILEALRQGMISMQQSENVIDELMDAEPGSIADTETVQEALTRTWKKNASKYEGMHLN